MGDQLHGIKPTEDFPKKGNVKRLFIFKINCTSFPGAFLTRKNMASQYCVKSHYTEQGCSLSSRFCKSTLHLGRVQWGQDEILYMGVIDWAHLLLHSCCFWANSQIHLAGLLCVTANTSHPREMLYTIYFTEFFSPCYISGRQAFRPWEQCTFQWLEMVMYKSGPCHTVLNAGSTSCMFSIQ